jgi:CRP/FNR family cyclic AMP-dependent transcriptional regulator
MKKFSAVFTIVNEKNCPLYKVDERLYLSDKTLSCPKGKEMCLILVRDLTELLFKFLQKQPLDLKNYRDTVFNCSGCTGLIKFSLVEPDVPIADLSVDSKDGRAVAQIDSAVLKMYGDIVDSSLLRALPPDQVEIILSQFREIILEEGTVLIRKGEKNLNLYIVFEGELVVESGGVHLATLSEGEICGEMSYLGADVAVSTVKAFKKSKVLAMAGDVFGSLLGNNREVQSYMAQLLAGRLRKTNAARARDFESCMSGRIDEIVPAELFQIFHMHQKTGVLTLELASGQAKVSFREGCIINASYCEQTNEEAIFKILAEKRGFYRFTTGLTPSEMKAAEIGDFMMLLMEGVKRVDEEQER